MIGGSEIMYDMDEMIMECEKKRKPNEEICFAIGAGKIWSVKRKERKQIEKAIDYIKSLDGFLGIHPVSMTKTLLIFDTLNNAKGAYNMMKAKNIQIGSFVVPILVDKLYINGGNSDE